jgi:hypothetical protein
MNEAFPGFEDRRKPKQLASEQLDLKKQRDSYVEFLFTRPRDEREQELKDRFDYIQFMQDSNWNDAFTVIDADIFTRDKLLHPDEFVPLLCYPNAPFALDFDIPVVDYYVQPKIITDRCSDSYDTFRDWLIQEDKGFFEDLIFIKSMSDLAVTFSFFAKTETAYTEDSYTHLLETDRGMYIDQNGYIVVPDERLNFTVSNSAILDFKDILLAYPDDLSPEYQRAFSNIVLYMFGELKRVQVQQSAISQLYLQHYLCPDLDFVTSNDNAPNGNVPRV